MSELRLLDPFLRDPFDDTLRTLMRPWRLSAADGAPRMRVDLSEQDEHYVVKADIPGVRKDDIDVRIDGNVVTLSAQSKSKKEERDDGRVLFKERQEGSRHHQAPVHSIAALQANMGTRYHRRPPCSSTTRFPSHRSSKTARWCGVTKPWRPPSSILVVNFSESAKR